MENSLDVISLQECHLDSAAETLLAAFRDEAFTAAWLDLSRERQWNAYYRIARARLRLDLESGGSIFLALKDGQAAGLLALKPPAFSSPRARALRYLLPQLPALLQLLPGMLRARHLAGALKPPVDLPPNHWTLEAIGVHPQYQGQGIGKLLLRQAHEHCLADGGASGIYLFTGDEKNYLIYQKQGYQLLERRLNGGFVSYHMFLPAPGVSG